MKVKSSKLFIIIESLIILLTYSFPFSSYIRLLCICGGAIYLIITHLSKKISAKEIYVWSYILFCMWATLSYTWASSAVGVTEQLFNTYVSIMANVLIVMFIVKKKENLDDIYGWLMPVSLIYLIQSILVGHFDEVMRFSPTGAVNQFGISTSYIFLFSLYFIKEKKTRSKISYIIMFLALALSILSGSRKALVNLVLFTCMILLFSKYDKNVFKNLGRILLVAAVAVLVIILVLKIPFLYDVIGNRLVTLFSFFNGDVTEDLSALRRDYMKEDAFKLFKQHPIVGIGLNNFKYVARYGTYAHSNYYELLCCLGIIGTLLYYTPIVIVSLKSFFQWKRNYSAAVIPFAIFLSFFINEFSNVSYMYRIIQFYIGIGAAMVFINDKPKKEENFK